VLNVILCLYLSIKQGTKGNKTITSSLSWETITSCSNR